MPAQIRRKQGKFATKLFSSVEQICGKNITEYCRGRKMTNNNDLRLKSQRYNHTLLEKQLQMTKVVVETHSSKK